MQTLRVGNCLQLGLVLGLLVLILMGCTPRSYLVNTMADIFDDGLTHFERDTDREMLRQSLPATIKMMEAFGASEPGNTDLALILSRLYAAYAEGFVFPDYLTASLTADKNGEEPPEALRRRLSGYHQKAMQAALRSLSKTNPQLETQLGLPERIRLSASRWTPKAVPGLFWYGFCLARYIDLNRDDVEALSKAYLVELIMLRVTEIWPDYYHGGAHTVLMSYYASRSPMLGGNPQKARYHYEQAKQIAPHLWLTDLSWGQFHLTRTQQREEFETLMTRISQVSADTTPHPFYNQLAALMADLYLSHTDQLF